MECCGSNPSSAIILSVYYYYYFSILHSTKFCLATYSKLKFHRGDMMIRSDKILFYVVYYYIGKGSLAGALRCLFSVELDIIDDKKEVISNVTLLCR